MRKFDVKVKGEGFIVKVCNLVNGQLDGNWKYYPMIFNLNSRSIQIHDEDNISYSEDYDSLFDMWEDGEFDSKLKCFGEDVFNWIDEDSYNISFWQNQDDDNAMFKNVRSFIEREMTCPFAIGYSNRTCYITCIYRIEIEDNETLDVQDIPLLKINDECNFLKYGIIPNQIMYKNTFIDPILTFVEERKKFFGSRELYYYDHLEGLQHNYDGYDTFLENFTTFCYTGSECCDINLKEYREQIYQELFDEFQKFGHDVGSYQIVTINPK